MSHPAAEIGDAFYIEGVGFASKFWCVKVALLGLCLLVVGCSRPREVLVEGGPGALATAAAEGDSALVAHLLGNGVDPNAKDQLGRTALYYAAVRGQAVVVDILVLRGAKVDAPQGQLGTALIYALYHQQLAVVKALLEHGADPNATTKRGLPALAFAKTPDGRSLLIGAGAKTQAMGKGLPPESEEKQENQKTVVPYSKPLFRAVNAAQEDVIRGLVTKGVRVDQRDENGFGPLFWAPTKGIVDLLVEAGAKVNSAAPTSGLTALHWVARLGKEEVVTALIRQGAQLNARDQLGNTPLHLAAAAGHKDTVVLLLKEGALADVLNKKGQPPSERARLQGHGELAESLRLLEE